MGLGEAAVRVARAVRDAPMWTASSVFAKSTLGHLTGHSRNQVASGDPLRPKRQRLLPPSDAQRKFRRGLGPTPPSPTPFSGRSNQTSLSHLTCSSTSRTVDLFLTLAKGTGRETSGDLNRQPRMPLREFLEQRSSRRLATRRAGMLACHAAKGGSVVLYASQEISARLLAIRCRVPRPPGGDESRASAGQNPPPSGRGTRRWAAQEVLEMRIRWRISNTMRMSLRAASRRRSEWARRRCGAGQTKEGASEQEPHSHPTEIRCFSVHEQRSAGSAFEAGG